MSSTTRQEVLRHLIAVTELQPPVQKTGKAPYPTDITHELFRAYTRSPHDVGGEVDVPCEWTEEEHEAWGHRAYVTTECLAWRGVWCAEERRRMQNVDLGTSQYLGLPYYGRWLLSAARILVDGHHVSLTELINKIDEVKKRYEPAR